MNINEYMKLIKEIKDKNGYEWDNSIAMFAIEKYIKTPAIRDYYSNLEIQRSQHGGRPIIYDMNGRIILAMGAMDYDFGEPKFKMCSNGAMPSPHNIKSYLTTESAANLSHLRETLDNANTYEDFVKAYEHSISNFRRLTKESKQFLKMTHIMKDYKGDQQEGIESIIYQELFETLDHFYGDPLRSGGYLASSLVLLKRGLTDDNIDEYENAISRIMKYDNIHFEISNYKTSSPEHRLKFQIKLSQEDHYRDNTLLGSVLNNTNNIVNAAMNNLVFEEAKSGLLLELKMILKEQTLEQLLDSDPIIDEIYQEAIKRSPSLMKTFDERFEHMTFEDSGKASEETGRIDFISYIDNVKLYDKNDSDVILEQQYRYGRLPTGTEYINPKTNLERLIGYDGYSPYYIITAHQAPLTMEIDSIVFNGFLVSRKLDDDKLSKMFENLFLTCLEKNKTLVIEDTTFSKKFEGNVLNLFNEVKEKYKGIIPTIILPEDNVKYKALLNSELTYNDLLRLEPKLNEMSANKMKQSDFEEFIKADEEMQKMGSKHTPKL